ncbi:uncharacterized protein LOC134531882 [Bacillus rossius redtenbacheri]|uniref:uncharacterized protein LOC134531882 n=1 Tax=Bacillus rossius redtenbacheri TaxID=93214 RepID=UPI002FDDC770
MSKLTINKNMVPLKCLLFLFFGGMGCLLPFLPRHMLLAGLTRYEACVVSAVAPLAAVLGPLAASPLCDRPGRRGAARPVRASLAASALLAALCYCLLMAVPTVRRLEPRLPAVSFSCDERGAAVLQERCLAPSCAPPLQDKFGVLHLRGCRHSCDADGAAAPLSPGNGSAEAPPPDATTALPADVLEPDVPDEALEADDYVDQAGDYADEGSRRRRRQADGGPSPHICDGSVCEVFTNASAAVTLNATLLAARDDEEEEGQRSEGGRWCRYPLSRELRCRVPQGAAGGLAAPCRISCDIDDPYTAAGSVLAQSECPRAVGDPQLTFWSYLVLRSLGDAFTAAAVTLLDASVVVATRETSAGRGDVGRELAWGALGCALFAPAVGAVLSHATGPAPPVYYAAFACFAALMLLSAVVVASARSAPLAPPEWWWHARGAPLGGAARSASEIAALSAVLVLLGALWSAIDSFLPWHLTHLQGNELLIGITLTVGALPAIPFLWNAEKVVEYCGHSNLLITAFTFYIIRYTGLSFFSNPWWVLLCEALEVFTLSLMWVTAILYMRHLVPRHFTATGQAIAVIAHFCVGRSLGAVLGAVLISHGPDEKAMVLVYQVGAVVACVVASLYFAVYHCCLKPRCLCPAGAAPRGQPPPADGPTTNGTYTPLKVYNNTKGQQKGQFRY